MLLRKLSLVKTLNFVFTATFRIFFESTPIYFTSKYMHNWNVVKFTF